jgi:hypothetical protein
MDTTINLSGGVYILQGPEGEEVTLTNGGEQVGAETYAQWTPIQADENPDGEGYRVLWQADNGDYTSWTVDGDGNWIAGTGRTAPDSADIFAIEEAHNIDLNDDAVVGDQAQGTALDGNPVTLWESTAGFYSLEDTTSGALITLKNDGEQVGKDTYSGWQAIQADPADGGGYRVLWRHDNGDYTSWTVDADGNWTAGTGRTTTDSADIFAIEITHDVDLTGDAVVGDQVQGTALDGNPVILWESTAGFYSLEDTASGTLITLKNDGEQVGKDTYGGWTGLAAVADPDAAEGFRVLWKHDSGDYTVWTVDAGGNWTEGTGGQSPDSEAVAGFERLFGLDLDGDGVIRGTEGDDVVYGREGDDVLDGLGGNDTLNGGDGVDVAIIADNEGKPHDPDQIDFSGLTVGPDGSVSGTVVGPDGTKTLSGTEVLQVANTGSSTSVVTDGMSLENAIDNASAGDTIMVEAGDYGDGGKGYTITIDKDVTLLGANAGTAAQDPRAPESVINGYINVTADDATIDGFRTISNHKSGGDQFIRLDGNNVTFVNNISTLETPLDSGGNGVSAGNDDTVENNIFAWQGNLMGRGDTGFNGAPASNDLYGAYWGTNGAGDGGWQTEFIIGTAGDDTLDTTNQDPTFDNFQGNPAKLNEFIRGEGGDDSLTGSDGDDTLIGGQGIDSVYGGDGDDHIETGYKGKWESEEVWGGAGDDTIDAGNGNDTVHGGDGDDSIHAARGPNTSVVNNQLFGDAGNDTITGHIGADSLDGGEGDDSLSGGWRRDTLIGGDGDDTLDGHRGNDSVEGGDGDDVLKARDGNDTLDGGNGDDTLVASWGSDTMTGGVGDDTFSAYKSTKSGAINNHVIEDFAFGEDTVILENLKHDPSFSSEGELAAVLLRSDVEGQATGDGLQLIMEKDGNGDATYSVLLKGIDEIDGFVFDTDNALRNDGGGKTLVGNIGEADSFAVFKGESHPQDANVNEQNVIVGFEDGSDKLKMLGVAESGVLNEKQFNKHVTISSVDGGTRVELRGGIHDENGALNDTDNDGYADGEQVFLPGIDHNLITFDDFI